MRELFAEFGAGEIVDFAVGLVGCWRHFLCFSLFFCGLGLRLGLRLGGCYVVVGSGWIKFFFWLLSCCGICRFGVEILSDRAAAMLSCREADDDETETKEGSRLGRPDTHIYILPGTIPSSYEYTSLHKKPTRNPRHHRQHPSDQPKIPTSITGTCIALPRSVMSKP